MREIKFRQWMSRNKYWHYFEFQDGICSGVISATLTENPIMQFTGLLDKNGREIYESDLIKVTDHPTGIDSMAQVEVIFDDGAFVCGYNGIRLSDYGSQWIEILGISMNHTETPRKIISTPLFLPIPMTKIMKGENFNHCFLGKVRDKIDLSKAIQ